MSRYLLDTDVIIEILKNREEVIREVEMLFFSAHDLLYSPVSKAEIFHEIRKGEEAKTARFFDQLDCIDINTEMGEKAGRYLKEFRKSHGIELGDALVAASARSARAILFTLNRKHYPMKDLRFY